MADAFEAEGEAEAEAEPTISIGDYLKAVEEEDLVTKFYSSTIFFTKIVYWPSCYSCLKGSLGKFLSG